MTEKHVIDLEVHEGDTVVSVWRQRMVLLLLIILVVAVSAPAFSGCGGALASKRVVASFEIGGKTHDVSDEELGLFESRFSAMLRLFSDPRRPQSLPEGEEGVKEALLILMLDEAAKAEGVHVSDEQVAADIRSNPLFQVNGKFDEARYRETMAQWRGGMVTHEILSNMRAVWLRVGEYERIYGAAFDVIPGDEAYQAWKKRNVRLTVDYVASTYESVRAKVEAIVPSEADLAETAKQPEGRAILAVPPAKTVEVAYLKPSEMSAEQFDAGKKFAAEEELFSESSPLEAEAFRAFFNERDTVFTKEHWGAVTDPTYLDRRRKYEQDKAAFDKLPKEEQEKQKDQAPHEPTDPTATYPGEPRAQYPLWKERVEKEVLAREIVKSLATRAEREGKSLTEMAVAYAQFGVKVAKNAEPLADLDLVQKFPDPVARDSEFDQIALNRFKPPAEGAVFKPQYQTEPVPTTRLADRIADRGFMVMRLESCDPARQYAIAEKFEPLRALWRKAMIAKTAREALEPLRKAAEAAAPDVAKMEQALQKAAADAGLTTSQLRRFSRTTEAPKPPVAAPGKELSAEEQAVARRISERNRVQQEYAALSTLDAGKFRDFADGKLDAAFLVFLVEKHEPAPVEMQDDDLRQERTTLWYQAMRKRGELDGFDAAAKRFGLQRFDEKRKKEPDVKAPEKTTEKPGGGKSEKQ